MVILDKAKLLEHETVFIYASEMDTRICDVMDQAGIPHIEMPAHRLYDNVKYADVPIPETAISHHGEMSDTVWAMISKIDPEYLAEKMNEIVFDEDLRQIELNMRTEVLSFPSHCSALSSRTAFLYARKSSIRPVIINLSQ